MNQTPNIQKLHHCNHHEFIPDTNNKSETKYICKNCGFVASASFIYQYQKGLQTGGRIMYQVIYKCRLCGATIESLKCIYPSMSEGYPHANVDNDIKYFPLTQEHYCPDDSFGVADFQGFRRLVIK